MNPFYKIIGCFKFFFRFLRKPTITSVVIAGLLKYLRRIRQPSSYSAVVYLRFMRFKTLSQPLCRERWKCGHTFPWRRVPIQILPSQHAALMNPDGFVSHLRFHESVKWLLTDCPSDCPRRKKSGGFRSARFPDNRCPQGRCTSFKMSSSSRLRILPRV